MMQLNVNKKNRTIKSQIHLLNHDLFSTNKMINIFMAGKFVRCFLYVLKDLISFFFNSMCTHDCKLTTIKGTQSVKLVIFLEIEIKYIKSTEAYII